MAGRYGADKFPTFYEMKAVGDYAVFGSPSEEYPGLVKVRMGKRVHVESEKNEILVILIRVK